MNKKTIITILSIILIVESIFFAATIYWAVEEHDLAVIRCEIQNSLIDSNNVLKGIIEDNMDVQVPDNIEKSVCRDAISPSIKNKLKEAKL